MRDYEQMSNTEISALHIQMKEEYEAIRLQLLQLIHKMKEMDKEYLRGKAILDKRLKRL